MVKAFATIVCLMLLLAPLAVAADFIYDTDWPNAAQPEPTAVSSTRTVNQVLARFGPVVSPGWQVRFRELELTYPPDNLTLIGLKEERRLEVWTRQGQSAFFLHAFDVLDASGLPGPKRRRGDHQVPEGIYRVDAFNPNSRFHLSMRINYPNDFDRTKGQLDGRLDLGDNIFIHGAAYSEGCLAIGDPAIEALFVLAAKVPAGRIEVILAPRDGRQAPLIPPRGLPDWVDDLYREIELALAAFTPQSTDAPTRSLMVEQPSPWATSAGP
ncbi:MAG: hypothetical protein EA370_10925 [Wenzhouxiangella sp.]|nr:MAG: hypothetical protein EA370_10925 [Wenzhouxiangella sp.]